MADSGTPKPPPYDGHACTKRDHVVSGVKIDPSDERLWKCDCGCTMIGNARVEIRFGLLPHRFPEAEFKCGKSESAANKCECGADAEDISVDRALAEAWGDYLDRHRDEIAENFERAAELIRAGDTHGLAEHVGRNRRARAEAAASDSHASIVWERFDYEHGETIWQRECPDCDRGLLLAPARFCSRCGGSGYLTTTTEPKS